MKLNDLAQLHEQFMSECCYSARLSSATLKNYQAAFNLLVRIIPTLTLDTLDSKTMMVFFKELETRERIVGRGKVRRGVKQTTVATYRAKLRPFLKWLLQKRYIAVDPFASLPCPKTIYDEPKYLKKEQIEKIVTAINFCIPWTTLFVQKRNMAIFTLLVCCGLRKTELLNLMTYDVDLARAEVRVNGSTSKSRQYRILPLNSLARCKLQDYLEERKGRAYVTPYLFASEHRDERLTEDGLIHVVKRISEAAGEPFHLHQLRHTFAVNLVSSGTDISVVQKLMGHKSIHSTLVYLRSIPTSVMRQSVEALRWNNLAT